MEGVWLGLRKPSRNQYGISYSTGCDKWHSDRVQRLPLLPSVLSHHHPSQTGYMQRPFHCLQDVFRLKRNLESLSTRSFSPQLPLHRHLLVESGKDKRQKLELAVPALPSVASVESSQLDPLGLVEGKYENWKFEEERVLQEHFCSSAITTIYT